MYLHLKIKILNDENLLNAVPSLFAPLCIYRNKKHTTSTILTTISIYFMSALFVVLIKNN